MEQMLGSLVLVFELVLAQLGLATEEPLQAEMVAMEPVELEDPWSIEVVAVGDVMLGRSVQVQSLSHDDWGWPFRKTETYLGSADLTIGNLENPLLDVCPVTNEGMIFCGRRPFGSALAAAGFDVVSLANNHSMNYGIEGYDETKNILEVAGVEYVDSVRILTHDVSGVQVGLVGFDDVSTSLDIAYMQQVIAELDDSANVVIPLVHWGEEYTASASARQVLLGRAMIDAGADVVIGAHPHWVQQVERYGDGYIFYSLGNFVFDQMWSEETRTGMVVKLKMQGTEEVETILYETEEVKIYEYGQPRFERSMLQ